MLRLVRDDQAAKPTAGDPRGKAASAPAAPGVMTVSWWQACTAGLVHGLLMLLAFPPVGLWGFALLAPLPLGWLTERGADKSGRWGLWAALGVMPFWLFEQSWVSRVSAVGYVPMCLYLALFTWLMVWAGGRIRRRAASVPVTLILPVVWVGVDFLRGSIAFDGYPWYFVAHPLIDAPRLAWPATFLGTYSVSFVVVALAGAVLDLRQGGRDGQARTGMVAIGVTAILIVAGGAWTSPAAVAGSRAALLRIALVQTNVPQDNKMGWALPQRLKDWERFEELTRTAAAGVPPPNLIVLPETMFPGWTLDPASLRTERARDLMWSAVDPPLPTTYFADRLLALQTELKIPIVIGAVGHDGFRFVTAPDGGVDIAFDARFNSALVVSNGEVQPARYDKIHLTPFGEAMPYISRWPWLQQQVLALGANGMSFDLSSGRRPVVLEVREPGGGIIRLATPICFEATMPGLCRSLVFSGGLRKADVLVNLTNDGWFGDWDVGRRQHMQLARWRCLELGTPMVRAANTGISALIDPWGRVLKSGVDGATNPARVDGVLVVDVPPPSGTTVYARVGDVFGIGVGGLAAALLLRTWVPDRAAPHRGRAKSGSRPKIGR